jgi:hypothetical protein
MGHLPRLREGSSLPAELFPVSLLLRHEGRRGGRERQAMKPIEYAHVKEFKTVYERNDPNKGPKWVEVKLQIIVGSRSESEAVCESLAAHMDTPLPRFLVLTEQPFEHKKGRKP